MCNSPSAQLCDTFSFGEECPAHEQDLTCTMAQPDWPQPSHQQKFTANSYWQPGSTSLIVLSCRKYLNNAHRDNRQNGYTATDYIWGIMIIIITL